MIAGAAYYASISESVLSGLEALDTSDYEWIDSDGWSQARYIDGTRGGSSHLEVWLDLGSAVVTRSHIEHSANVVFAARYQADDDSISQARAHAAARAAVDYLIEWAGPSGERMVPSGWAVDVLSEDWLIATIIATLITPR